MDNAYHEQDILVPSSSASNYELKQQVTSNFGGQEEMAKVAQTLSHDGETMMTNITFQNENQIKEYRKMNNSDAQNDMDDELLNREQKESL